MDPGPLVWPQWERVHLTCRDLVRQSGGYSKGGLYSLRGGGEEGWKEGLCEGAWEGQRLNIK